MRATLRRVAACVVGAFALVVDAALAQSTPVPIVPGRLDGYLPPPELSSAWESGRLNNSPTMYTVYSCVGESIEFSVCAKNTVTEKWDFVARQAEPVAFFVTAIAPVYSGNWDSLYVIGVRNDGATVIEKWRLTVTLSPRRSSGSIVVKRDERLATAALTHIRAAAAAPNDQFLVVQRLETAEVLKLTLDPPTTTVLLGPSAYPNLRFYDVLEWQRHVTQGDVFRLVQGSGTCVITHTGQILIWDTDLDGVPNLVEELTSEQSARRGYQEGAVWEPNRTLFTFH